MTSDRQLMQRAFIELKDLRDGFNPESTHADEVLEALRARLAQPEQEPVACVQDLDEVKRKHLVYEKAMDWKDPLYTTPPQREWQGLTDEDIYKMTILMGFNPEWKPEVEMVYTVVRNLEAKLKEKNA